jgi:hypothetical protein
MNFKIAVFFINNMANFTQELDNYYIIIIFKVWG